MTNRMPTQEVQLKTDRVMYVHMMAMDGMSRDVARSKVLGIEVFHSLPLSGSAMT